MRAVPGGGQGWVLPRGRGLQPTAGARGWLGAVGGQPGTALAGQWGSAGHCSPMEGLAAPTGSKLLLIQGQLSPCAAAGGELQVKLQSAAGQHTAWSVAGQRSQGWQSSTVPLESPSEFQIVFEITSRMWPMDGTVALDDIEYSATGGCDSNLEAPGKVKSSSSFVAEVVVGLLLAVIVLALVAAGGRYWLKRRAQESGMAMESNTPQGFDNITFQDDKVIIAQVPKERDED